jgi:hypothetical protein
MVGGNGGGTVSLLHDRSTTCSGQPLGSPGQLGRRDVYFGRSGLSRIRTNLWEVGELWDRLGQLDEVLDLKHAAVLLVRHLAKVLPELLGLALSQAGQRGTVNVNVVQKMARSMSV